MVGRGVAPASMATVTPRPPARPATNRNDGRLITGPFVSVTATAFVFFLYIGMVIVVVAALTSATLAMSPVHASNSLPAGGASAAMFTTSPAAYVPSPVPEFTVSV